jgi:hypothetical protein
MPRKKCAWTRAKRNLPLFGGLAASSLGKKKRKTIRGDKLHVKFETLLGLPLNLL